MYLVFFLPIIITVHLSSKMSKTIIYISINKWHMYTSIGRPMKCINDTRWQNHTEIPNCNNRNTNEIHTYLICIIKITHKIIFTFTNVKQTGIKNQSVFPFVIKQHKISNTSFWGSLEKWHFVAYNWYIKLNRYWALLDPFDTGKISKFSMSSWLKSINVSFCYDKQHKTTHKMYPNSFNWFH